MHELATTKLTEQTLTGCRARGFPGLLTCFESASLRMEILDDYSISEPVRRKLALLDVAKQRAILHLGDLCIALLLFFNLKVHMNMNENQFEPYYCNYIYIVKLEGSPENS